MVTTIYAALLGLIFIGLSVYTILGRFKYGVSLGDGGQDDMFKRVRAHSNFIEYVPLALVMMILIELDGASETLLHILGSLLIIGRLSHAFGIVMKEGTSLARSGGMVLTFLVILICAVVGIKSFFIF